MTPFRRSFVVGGCLGRGGFGDVYRARMAGPSGVSTEVALKVLRRQGDDGQARQRMRDEGKLLARLDHPAVVKVHDLVVIEGRLALVTELIDGQPLAACLSGPDPLPLAALLEVVARTAEALDAAWSALRLVHRDIKPSNLFVSRHGEVRVLDFGLARSDEITREAHTRSDLLVGSPAYMAPERFVPGDVDPASDVYALGATLYEGIAGARLLDQPIPVAIAIAVAPDRHAATIADRLSRLDVPSDLLTLLRETLAFDRRSRPSAADLSRRCEALAAQLGGVTLARWCRERTWSRTAESPGELSGRTITEGDAVAAPSPRRRRAPWRSIAAAGVGMVAMLSGMSIALAAAWWWTRPPPSSPSVVVIPQPVWVREEVRRPPGPGPGPGPGPATSVPVPLPGTVPAPVPDPVAAPRVIVHDENEATITFVGPNGTFSAEDVPEGSYEIVARFAGRDAPLTQSVVLEPGGTYTVRCNARMFRCDVR